METCQGRKGSSKGRRDMATLFRWHVAASKNWTRIKMNPLNRSLVEFQESMCSDCLKSPATSFARQGGFGRDRDRRLERFFSRFQGAGLHPENMLSEMWVISSILYQIFMDYIGLASYMFLLPFLWAPPKPELVARDPDRWWCARRVCRQATPKSSRFNRTMMETRYRFFWGSYFWDNFGTHDC